MALASPMPCRCIAMLTMSHCEPAGLHGSFANTSDDLRISLTFGFHRHRSVLGATGALSESESVRYDEERIAKRSAVIGVAIDASAVLSRSTALPANSRP